MKKAIMLKKDFENLSKKLGMKSKVIITNGSEPIGNGIGPALEARDVLYVLRNDKEAPLKLKNKSLKVAGMMLELSGKVGRGCGLRAAKKILESGKAYQKFIEIIKAQGGKEKAPEKICVGRFKYNLRARKAKIIKYISNSAINKIARVAGAPENKAAGLYLYKHVGDKVKKGDLIFTIYSNNRLKLEHAIEAYKKLDGLVFR
jgi:thymidine phosphorylase